MLIRRYWRFMDHQLHSKANRLRFLQRAVLERDLTPSALDTEPIWCSSKATPQTIFAPQGESRASCMTAAGWTEHDLDALLEAAARAARGQKAP